MNTLTIGLLWHSVNSDNLGVGALTASHIAILEELGQRLGLSLRFKIFGWKDTQPAYIVADNVEAANIRYRELWYPSKYHRELAECDFIIDISAGDSFTDIYGRFRILSNLLSKAGVFWAQKPLVFGPQTIGPFNHPIWRFFSYQMMRWTYLVTTRDQFSTDQIASLELGDKVIEATDVAMRLPFVKSASSDVSKPTAGINVSGLLFNGGYTGKNMFDLNVDYSDVIRRIIAELSSVGAEVHLVGHVNSQENAVEDDYRVCDTLFNEFPNIKLAPRFKNPCEAKSYISGLDFFAGARMHACIAAFSSGVPVVPMAYSRKFEGLFGTLGYHRVVDCKTESAQTIVDVVVSGFQNRAALRAEVHDSYAKADAKLKVYEDRLETLMKKLANR